MSDETEFYQLVGQQTKKEQNETDICDIRDCQKEIEYCLPYSTIFVCKPHYEKFKQQMDAGYNIAVTTKQGIRIVSRQRSQIGDPVSELPQ